MPRKKKDDYSDDDDDYDSDDGYMANVKIQSDEGPKKYLVNGDTYAHFPIPIKLWPYDYITTAWKEYIQRRGIGDKRLKSFLTEDTLVNGSENGGVETRWSGGHEFWRATIEATGQESLFFSGDSIDELCNMLAEQCDQTAKSVIKPDINKSIKVATGIEPRSLKPFKPDTVDELRTALDEVKGKFFSFILSQSRNAWESISTRGGAALCIKTQRYEATEEIVLEVGWSVISWERKGKSLEYVEDSVHAIVKEYEKYRNGIQLPNNRDLFGFGTSTTLREEDTLKELDDTITSLSLKGPLLIVFYGADFELSYFSKEMDIKPWRSDFGMDLFRKGLSSSEVAAAKIRGKEAKEPHYPIVIQDAQRLFAAYTMDPASVQVGLQKACQYFKIPCRSMCNAGNDAYYLLQLYDNLMTSATRPK